MLTAKGKYGLKALVHLAQFPPGELALVSNIATANNIPKKFLDAILGDLRNAGIVQSRKGKGGGYRLARLPEDIKVGSIVRVLDGPLAPIPCASYTPLRGLRRLRCGDLPGSPHHAECPQRHRRGARSHHAGPDARRRRRSTADRTPDRLT